MASTDGPEDRLDRSMESLVFGGGVDNDEHLKFLHTHSPSLNWMTESACVAYMEGGAHLAVGRELLLHWFNEWRTRFLHKELGRVYAWRHICVGLAARRTALERNDVEVAEAAGKVPQSHLWFAARSFDIRSRQVLTIGGRSLGLHGFGPAWDNGFLRFCGVTLAALPEPYFFKSWRTQAILPGGPLHDVLPSPGGLLPSCRPLATYTWVEWDGNLAILHDGAPGSVSKSTGSVLGVVSLPGGLQWLPGGSGDQPLRWRSRADEGRCWYDPERGELRYTSVIPGYESVRIPLDLPPWANVVRWGPAGVATGSAHELLGVATGGGPPPPPPPEPPSPPCAHPEHASELRRIAAIMRNAKRPKWRAREAAVLEAIAEEIA